MLLFHLTSIEKFNHLKVIIAFKSSSIVRASYGPTVLHGVRAILLVGKYTNLKSRHQWPTNHRPTTHQGHISSKVQIFKKKLIQASPSNYGKFVYFIVLLPSFDIILSTIVSVVYKFHVLTFWILMHFQVDL